MYMATAVGRDSSVGVEPGYGLDGPGIEFIELIPLLSLKAFEACKKGLNLPTYMATTCMN
jgi:hypothetical protein